MAESTSPPTGGDESGKPNMKVELAFISPEEAQQIITNGKYNRRESKATWKRYSRDITNGKWVPNGVPIILNGSTRKPGTLLDGYHRLMAIVDSNIGIWTVMVSGVPDVALHTIDGGRPRSLGTRFEIDGEHAPRVLADLIKFLTVYRHLGTFRGSVFTTSEYYDTLAEEPDTRRFAQKLVRKMPVPWLRAGLVGVAWYLFDQKDLEMATEFCESVITGENLKAGHPAYVFRDWVSRLPEKNRSVGTIANALFECWNQFRRGETIKRFRVPVDCPDIE